jgi:hypothetical protein
MSLKFHNSNDDGEFVSVFVYFVRIGRLTDVMIVCIEAYNIDTMIIDYFEIF